MWNPLKMNPVEKRLLLGGLLNSLIYHAEKAMQTTIPNFPNQLKGRLDPNLPTNGEIIATVAPPIALYTLKKISKDSTRKEKIGDLAFGSLLYALPNLMARTGSRIAYAQGAAQGAGARLTQPIATGRYTQATVQRTIVGTPVAPSVGKYRITA